MKKTMTNKSLLAALFTVLLFTACSKDENETAKLQGNAENEEMLIQGNAFGTEPINGLISKDAAERMQDNFNKKFASSNGTEHIAFSVNDLGNYVKQLKNKYKSDSVYVSFGVYDEKTAVNKKDIGRITVFFFGKNNNPNQSGNIRSQEVLDDGTGTGSNYFNHGSIWP
jgi:hypothetical protein